MSVGCDCGVGTSVGCGSKVGSAVETSGGELEGVLVTGAPVTGASVIWDLGLSVGANVGGFVGALVDPLGVFVADSMVSEARIGRREQDDVKSPAW